jgi:hypothetical protein
MDEGSRPYTTRNDVSRSDNLKAVLKMYFAQGS